MKDFCTKEEIKNICGQRIRAARLSYYPAGRRMTQGELAAKLQLFGADFTRITINRIEKGERALTDYELVFIAEALNTDVMYLMFGGRSPRDAVTYLTELFSRDEERFVS